MRGVLVAAIAWTLIGCVFLGMVEVGVRSLGSVNADTGIPLIGRLAWLPYVPEADAAQRSWEVAGGSTYVVRDDELGWAIRPGGKAAMYTATAQGFRGPLGASFLSAVPPGVERVVVYGDSFTHGDEVRLEDTWGDRLQRLGTAREVLNFGVPGFGTDQALLRFRRDGRAFEAQTQVLGIWPEDAMRNLSVIRFYLIPQGNIGTSKPRFVLGANGLELVNSPVLGESAFMDTVLQRTVAPVMQHDRWYDPDELRWRWYYGLHSVRAVLGVYNAYRRREARNTLYFDPQGEALLVTAALAETFVAEARARGSRAFVTVLPMRDLLESQGDGRFPLPAMLRARGVPVIDLGPGFAAKATELGEDALFLPDGHLTPAANGLAAQILDEQLFPRTEPAAER
jgi:hypothetical protein